jgi:hypothetical protein
VANDEAKVTSQATFVAPTAAKEEFCLALLFREPALAQLGLKLSDDLFSLSENRELFRRWRAGESVVEEEEGLWEHYLDVIGTRIAVSETAQAEVAFLDCMDRLEQARMRAIKEASALALAEGETGVRPGQVASIARAMIGAGEHEDAPGDAEAEAVASRLLDDMEAGLRFHRRLIESSRPDQVGRQPEDL